MATNVRIQRLAYREILCGTAPRRYDPSDSNWDVVRQAVCGLVAQQVIPGISAVETTTEELIIELGDLGAVTCHWDYALEGGRGAISV